jgi:hypothetical protein
MLCCENERGLIGFEPPIIELPRKELGGGPCGVNEAADEGGGPAGVVDGFDCAKIFGLPLLDLRSGVDGGLDE